jgi:hypothetical protein
MARSMTGDLRLNYVSNSSEKKRVERGAQRYMPSIEKGWQDRRIAAFLEVCCKIRFQIHISPMCY